MNLRRLRYVLTALVGLVTSTAVVVLALVAFSNGSRRIRAATQREAEQQITDVLVRQRRGEEVKDAPVWTVNDNGDSSDLGKNDVEPPLRGLYAEAGGHPHTDRFTQRDEDYLAYVLPIGPKDALVTVVPLADEEARRSSLRLRLVLLSSALVAAATATGWFVAGRAVRPAREALVERRGFLADAAHEMRTPLAVIQASASQALARPRAPEEYVRSLSEIRAASERAAAGVNELLDLARLESGQAMPRLAPLRLDLLAEEVAASVRADGCELTAEPGIAVVVDADMALLRQAVENVVRNAVRRASSVRLVASIDGRDGVLDVLDDGPGFEVNLLPHVFDRYRRGDGRGEVGLGLSLVQAIVAAHGGEASAANRPDGGAVVRLRVALTRAGLA
jgi:two-component system OmpR family sensor kinase